MKIYFYCITYLISILCFADNRPTLVVINLQNIIKTINHKISQNPSIMKGMDKAKFNQQLTQKKRVSLPADTSLKKSARGSFYRQAIPGIAVVLTYKFCNKCPHKHPKIIGTAYCIAPGTMVTNEHVLAAAKNNGTVFVSDIAGNITPLTKILSSDKAADVAIFSIKNKRAFQPLPLAKHNPHVGTNIFVIGHPQNELYVLTTGIVSRYATLFNSPNIWMEITADYAPGSSGSPILNKQGEVVGTVSRLRSIYRHKKDKSEFQMNIRKCVPLSALRKLLH